MKFLSAFLFTLLLAAGPSIIMAQEDYEGIAAPNEYDYYDYASNDDVNGDEVVENEPPVALPKFIDEPQNFTVKVGESVTFPCRSIEGEDQVLIINKLRMNGKELLIAAGGNVLHRPDTFTVENNQLTINEVSRTDRGKYVCAFQNEHEDRVTLTHILDVQFEPSFFIPTKTIKVKKGETVEMGCAASGNPKPTITWKKQGATMPSGVEEEEGTQIEFEDVDRHIAGTYICTANNGVGEPANGTRNVVVDYMPEIETEKERLHTGNGDKIELVCIVYAHPTAEIEWRHNDSVVNTDTFAEMYNGGHRHVLTLESVSEADFGKYDCLASNPHGVTSKSIIVTDAPSTPVITSDPHSSEEESYTVAWTSESFYPIVQYKIQFRKSKANETTDEPGEWIEVSEEVEAAEGNEKEQEFQNTLSDLERATDYQARVSVRNNMRDSMPAEFSFSTRKEQADSRSTSGASTKFTSTLAVIFLTFVLLAQ